jgi:hypothetical protein
MHIVSTYTRQEKKNMINLQVLRSVRSNHLIRLLFFFFFFFLILLVYTLSIPVVLAQEEVANIDCNVFGSDVAYYKEGCYNTTHYLVQTGSCVNGQLQSDDAASSTEIGPCSDDEEGGVGMNYCHVCSSSSFDDDSSQRLVCSSHSDSSQACPWALQGQVDASTLGDTSAVCNDNDNDNNIAAGDSTATVSGCSSHSYYYYASLSCTTSSSASNTVALQHKVRLCAEDFGATLPYCASCADGYQLCAASSSAQTACGRLGTASSNTTKYNFVQDALTGGTNTGGGGGGGAGAGDSGSDSGSSNTTLLTDTQSENQLGYDNNSPNVVLSLPVEGIIDCASFESGASISFYREECYNATHYVITVGDCNANGQLVKNATSEASACSVAGDALQYCHVCSGGSSTSEFATTIPEDYYTHSRLVCAESPNVNDVCPGVLQRPEPTCSGTPSASITTLLGLPAASQRQATATGCVDESSYFYTYELCETESLPGSLAVMGRTTAPCATPTAGAGGDEDEEEASSLLQYCSTCLDGWQLCASSPTACGSHGTVPLSLLDYSGGSTPSLPDDEDNANAEELILPVTTDCSTFNGGQAVSWYKEDCYNETHYRISSGLCQDGQVIQLNSSVVVTSCASALPDGTDEDPFATMDAFCHVCHDGQLICSSTAEVSRVCGRATSPTNASDNNGNNDDDPHCAAMEYRSSSKTGCVDATTMFYQQLDCLAGIYTPTLDSKTCAALYGDEMSNCVQCVDGHQLCTNDVNACAAHGTVDLSDQTIVQPTPDTDNNDASQVLYLPVDIDCSTFQGNVGFYREDCFNTTHYVIVQGNCIDGQLLDAVTSVSPCTDAGDDTLTYCHSCDYKLVCSALQNPHLVCARAMATPEPLCVASHNQAASYTACTPPGSTSLSASESFFYNLETCQAGEFLLQPSVETCSDVYGDELNICLACTDGMQLCASQVDGCGQHGVATSTPPPPEWDDGNSNGGDDATLTVEVNLDCSTFMGNAAWYREDCYNATHFYYSSGSCIQGELINASSVVQSCHAIHDTLQYCHGCNNKLTCSQEPDVETACASAYPDPPVCRESTNILSQSQRYTNSWSTLTGCSSATSFYYNAEECEEGSFYNEPWDGPCLEAYPGTNLGRCLTCADGMQLCAAEADACGSHGDIESNNAPTNIETIPVTGVDCDTFDGAVQFHKESCHNATHMVETTGYCAKGLLQDAKSQVTPCSAAGPTLTFCHECSSSSTSIGGQNKLVCSELNDKDQVCGSASSNPPVCANNNDLSATMTGCSSNSGFFYTYETCGDGQLVTFPHLNDCNELFPGYGQCLACEDGFQLCSASASGCGSHGTIPTNHVTGDNVVLAPPIDCSQVNGDFNFYTEKCLNASHMVTWSGMCSGGLFAKSQPEILACSSGPGASYCHECPGSHVVCSTSNLRDTACAMHKTDGSSSCGNSPDATGSFSGCL